MNDPTLESWRRLGCAVLTRAYKDAAHGNGHSQEARHWLAGDDARWWVGLLDLDPAGLDYALAGLPLPDYEQLRLPTLG